MPYKRYVYTVRYNDYECTCGDMSEVAKAINERSGLPVITRDMVNNYFVRPNKANKRLFSWINIQRTALPTAKECTNRCVDPDRKKFPEIRSDPQV
jgi:hypothetical protein